MSRQRTLNPLAPGRSLLFAAGFAAAMAGGLMGGCAGGQAEVQSLATAELTDAAAERCGSTLGEEAAKAIRSYATEQGGQVRFVVGDLTNETRVFSNSEFDQLVSGFAAGLQAHGGPRVVLLDSPMPGVLELTGDVVRLGRDADAEVLADLRLSDDGDEVWSARVRAPLASPGSSD
jgi:hypothetical protein